MLIRERVRSTSHIKMRWLRSRLFARTEGMRQLKASSISLRLPGNWTQRMKKLLLLRHAKSDWGDASLPDLERPLNERGRGAATLMGTFMRGQNLRPDLLISSPSRRTRET